MQDIAGQLHAWHTAGRPFAVATVTAVSGSAPREPGAALAVDEDGEAVGSVSGGCVEGEVYELCREVLRTGRPVVRHFGYGDEDAFAAGLTCGGSVDVLVQRVRPGADAGLDAALAAVAEGLPVALVRVVAGPPELLGAALAVTADGSRGSLGGGPLEAAAAAGARAMLAAGRTGRVVLDREGRPCGEEAADGVVLLVESYAAPPRMLVFGAIDFAAAVARIGVFLGYRVTVCDARAVFATARRFPDADEVVVDWPHRYLEREAAAGALDGRTVVCVLTHDEKFDVPLLTAALRLPVAYVGAMGSRRTHRDRLARLRAAGLTDAELARLRSPIGLDLGGRTPEETAVAVAAEIVAHRRGGTCLPLTLGEGPVHGGPAHGGPEHDSPEHGGLPGLPSPPEAASASP
ncbi:XdhC family protein [Streptacidiphilus sp. ASG 303]|uniref:XdhC family protein n=1 Tax=Streptacidiphilus sp. ASG 303 TaxID=2896847 RepID=UPI001E63BFED|nr:XdhC/CoxI family protein [Streptacidiphilus sp. ASG 303]MCD0481441.1 XdhC family protein [Streptacidiphilus sp. ASG 303]